MATENDIRNQVKNQEDAWLENLKVGDKVIIAGSGFSGHNKFISKVTRFTKTLIFVDGQKFHKISGVAQGKWQHAFLIEATIEHLDDARTFILYSNLTYKFKGYAWKELPLETLVAINNLLPKKELDKSDT